jgi:hypothetical protein
VLLTSQLGKRTCLVTYQRPLSAFSFLGNVIVGCVRSIAAGKAGRGRFSLRPVTGRLTTLQAQRWVLLVGEDVDMQATSKVVLGYWAINVRFYCKSASASKQTARDGLDLFFCQLLGRLFGSTNFGGSCPLLDSKRSALLGRTRYWAINITLFASTVNQPRLLGRLQEMDLIFFSHQLLGRLFGSAFTPKLRRFMSASWENHKSHFHGK